MVKLRYQMYHVPNTLRAFVFRQAMNYFEYALTLAIQNVEQNTIVGFFVEKKVVGFLLRQILKSTMSSVLLNRLTLLQVVINPLKDNICY